LIEFLYRRRLFSKPLSIKMPALYLYDLLMLPFLFISILVIKDLSAFDGRAANEVSAHSFALLGTVGLYGLRVATWICIARHNRMPQTAEWTVTLAGLAVLVGCIVLSPQLTETYAGSRGYRLCGPVVHHREVTLLFAKQGDSCPPRPRGEP
jgi:hypothetical protein